jgi:hypothetical protein
VQWPHTTTWSDQKLRTHQASTEVSNSRTTIAGNSASAHSPAPKRATYSVHGISAAYSEPGAG